MKLPVKHYNASIDRSLYLSLGKLVDYLYNDEHKDFESAYDHLTPEEREEHVYNDVIRVSTFLEELAPHFGLTHR